MSQIQPQNLLNYRKNRSNNSLSYWKKSKNLILETFCYVGF